MSVYVAFRGRVARGEKAAASTDTLLTETRECAEGNHGRDASSVPPAARRADQQFVEQDA
jgi:hypothetical protein